MHIHRRRSRGRETQTRAAVRARHLLAKVFGCTGAVVRAHLVGGRNESALWHFERLLDFEEFESAGIGGEAAGVEGDEFALPGDFLSEVFVPAGEHGPAAEEHEALKAAELGRLVWGDDHWVQVHLQRA